MLIHSIIAAVTIVSAQASSPPANGTPTLSIEGRVVSEQGDPMPRMRILLSYPGESGIAAPLSFSGADGAFKVTGVKPGDYRLCADPGPILSLIRTEGRFEGEHPIRACNALSVSTRSLSGVEITMRRGPLYSVSASLIDADGNRLPASSGSLALRDGPTPSSIDVKHAADGQFVTRGVPPGDYVITARRVAPDGMVLELGSAPVRVTTTDVDGIVVRTKRPVRIAGRVEFAEGLSGPWPRINVNTVGLRSRPPGPFENSSHVREDLTFQIDGLLGPQMLQVFGAMKPWTAKAIRYRGEDIYGKSVEFVSSSNPDDLVVVLTSQSASVTAKLRSPSEQPGGETIVWLIPLDPKTGAPLENAAFRPIDGEGPFGLPLVRPGDYLIAAITKEDAVGQPSSIARRLAPVSQRITLAPGEHRVIALDLVRPK